MQYFITILSLIIINGAIAQFNDSFTDGDFSSIPTWAGDDSVFTIFSSAGNDQLRSNKTIPSSSFYLSTPSTNLTNSQWEFFTKLAFNTSSTNFVDCYLTADQANLKSATLNGYFVRLGGTLDEVCLYKKINGIATKIIDGTDGILNAASSSLKLKITCSSSNLWELLCDQTGVGTDYQSLGTITDSSISSSNYVGIVVTQSTASFFQKHYFDDFYVGPIIYDLTPPELLTATAVSNQTITLLFDEKLDQNSAEITGNYSIQNATSSISINTVTLDPVDKKIVHLTTSQLANGGVYTLTANGIKDLALNTAGSQQTTFQYLVNDTVKKGELIINEFLCDESPSVGLPKVEYIEIYNKSNKYFNLNGFKISDGSSNGTIGNKWIFPGEYVILCANSSVDSFSVNQVVGVSSFPSLNNSGDSIILKDTGNLIIDQLLYSSEWYKDETKGDGGYSLELINPNDPCSDGDNWKASEANNGGTPGAMNAIYDTTADQIAPNIQSVYVSDSNQVTITFSEGMDTFSLQNVVFNCYPPLTIALQINSNNKQLILTFNEQLLGSQNYTFTLENAQDCWGNTQLLTAAFVRPEAPILGELIVNELLVDPKTGGSDWVELYNNSDKVIDLFKVQFANYDDSIANFKKVSIHYYLKPAQYAVIGNDSAFVKSTYPAAISGTFIQCATPSYNNDSGTVYLFYDSLLLEKVAYSSKWHFPLLENTDGVALERINPNNSLNDENNWHSAAEAIGFGTPGKINSQILNQQQQGDFQLSSKTISPDNDGYEDFLLIHYQLLKGGMVGTIKIFDAAGRLIKQLISNELLGTSGEFKWDGTRDSGVKATIGNYIILFEAFSLSSGEKFTKTKVVIVAGIL
jgi:hypothetical protein